MTRISVVALALVAIAPVAAPAATVVAFPSAESTDFSLPALMDGTDHVLSSVDGLPLSPTDPFGAGAAAFAATDRTALRSNVARPAINTATDATSQEPLPEPATWLMMILGFFGLSFAVRRRSSPTGNRVRFS